MVNHERLVDLLRYDPSTGIFTWLNKPSRRVVAGTAAGALMPNGYVYLMIAKVPYCAHRLAWFYMTGSWPVAPIDHINGVRNDNRWANIREAASFPNQQNVRSATRRSKLGVLGVSVSGRGYRATVRLNGKNHYSGPFATTQEAYATYVAMKRRLHLGCTL